jgi:group I intron endonuclease
MFRVYQIQNTITGRVYIGKTHLTLKKRWGTHCYLAKRGSELYFHRAIRKYGADAFVASVLYDELTEEAANQKEVECIAAANSVAEGYNIMPGGEGAPQGWSGANKGKQFPEKWRNNIRQSLIGRTLSPEHRLKVIAALEKNPRSAEVYEKTAAKLRGRKRPEIGEKVRKANLGKLRTPVVERECPSCGSVFQTRTNTMGRKFCSKSCACRYAGQQNSRLVRC